MSAGARGYTLAGRVCGLDIRRMDSRAHGGAVAWVQQVQPTASALARLVGGEDVHRWAGQLDVWTWAAYRVPELMQQRLRVLDHARKGKENPHACCVAKQLRAPAFTKPLQASASRPE
jgi:hypothetical protein